MAQAESLEETHKLVLTYRDGLALEAAFSRTKGWWDDLLGTIEVRTPEPAADFLINRWLLYQSLSCRIWGRSAFYQSGGAFGIRDQLQDVPEIALESATLFEHCRRAVRCGLNFGPHGLPLMGAGDWNDGMNRMGAGGKGESVWLAWFLVDVLQGMVELSEHLGQAELSRTYQQEREALVRQVERAAWDGEWYLRAIFDDGTLLGSSASQEARIDSLPQSWALMSGAADPDRAARALDSGWKHLVREEEGLVLLFDPPFDQSKPSPGYIQASPPGIRENGGQYTQAALWFAMALARRGDGSRAVKLLRLLNPIERARDPETIWRYGLEPYAVAADIYRLPGRIGQGGWSWYTGSAAWMYRAWIEEVLGLTVRGDRLQLNPVIPGHWEGFELRYRHGEA